MFSKVTIMNGVRLHITLFSDTNHIRVMTGWGIQHDYKFRLVNNQLETKYLCNMPEDEWQPACKWARDTYNDWLAEKELLGNG